MEGVKGYYDRSAQALERRKLACRLDATETESIAGSLPPAPESLLDVGCGTGHLLDRVRVPLKVGVDLSISMLRLARQRGCGAPLVLADGGRLPIREYSFEIVVSQDVMGHFRTPGRLAGEMIRVCRPGGRLLVTVAKRGIFSRMIELYSRIWLGVYVRSFSEEQVEKIFEASGARCLTKESIGGSVVKLLATPRPGSQGSD